MFCDFRKLHCTETLENVEKPRFNFVKIVLAVIFVEKYHVHYLPIDYYYFVNGSRTRLYTSVPNYGNENIIITIDIF